MLEIFPILVLDFPAKDMCISERDFCNIDVSMQVVSIVRIVLHTYTVCIYNGKLMITTYPDSAGRTCGIHEQ